MQASVINFKKIIAFLAALVLNMIVSLAFARLFSTFITKQQKVYTVYVYTNAQTNLSKPTHTKNTSHFFTSQKTPLHSAGSQHKILKQAQPLYTQTIAKSQPSEIKPLTKTLENNKNAVEVNSEQTSNSYKALQENISSKANSDKINANAIDIQSQPQIANWIEKHKFYPQKAIFKGEQGKIKLVFFIDKDGNLQNISILEKTEYDTLNKAAIKILHDSSPIPKKLLTNVNLPVYAKINIIFKLE